MNLEEKFGEILKVLMDTASKKVLSDADFKDICEYLHVSKMYYDMNLGDEGRYTNHRTNESVIPGRKEGDKYILFDDGRKTDLLLKYTYFYEEELEYVHAYIEFVEGITQEQLDPERYQFMADIVYLLVSRQNMRIMLDFAEIVDVQTGIPNGIFIRRQYEKITRQISPGELDVLYINLQNFKYINEVAGAKAGDEAIIRYSRILLTFMGENESVCRMGGDNFVMFIKREHRQEMIQKLKEVRLEHLATAPNQVFEIAAWIGIAEAQGAENKPFVARIEEASVACNMGKSQLKQEVVVFSEELKKKVGQGREIIAIFPKAVKNHEFHPFFQAKVDMKTGKLVGFEALCRWIHDGKFIYPDQFIPVLDREGLIHDLDMAIFGETCAAIRRWMDMGLNPPRVSSNFSRKNLFVPEIEEKIYRTIAKNGISTENIEIEITETVKESEYNRLIEFVRTLKDQGMHISIDDFGTGYSSLSLIHNIDADVVKIDKSFVDEIPGNHKSEVLIESIINIASRLDMTVIAEGVETWEQGKELMRLGCRNAQGYYYSKPVDYDTATELIRNPRFEAI